MSSNKKTDKLANEIANDGTKGAYSIDELTADINNLLDVLTVRFERVSAEINSKMDDMSRRLDNLEAAMHDGEDNPAKPPNANPTP
ncbi:hypothetical protein GGR54DRAFT_642031 [Hypoxylon sp. NC1633]|nr:hypothetical protein GGR54DRAFT_642031 [Hypoxylon sp. NC1633]